MLQGLTTFYEDDIHTSTDKVRVPETALKQSRQSGGHKGEKSPGGRSVYAGLGQWK